MSANSFGQIFRITTFGESHGKAIGLIIDGCPAGIPIDEAFIQSELDRRKPGQSSVVTQRKEPDQFEIQSGVFDGVSTGTPISLVIRNKDQKSKDYSHIAKSFRPSHADFTYQQKYGIRDYRGGGRSSARETAARVAAGAIAKIILEKVGIQINAFVSQVGSLKLSKPYTQHDFSMTEESIMRCPDPKMSEEMISLVKSVRKEGETIGGMVSCIITGAPIGLGAPVFHKLHADLGGAMLGINAVKGFEYGSGFDCIEMKGSDHNDVFYKDEDGTIKTNTNHSGGVQGGISNGMDIYFNVAFKPVATVMRDQSSVDLDGNETTVTGKGRHDPCVVPRAVPIVEAMAALVLVDHYLMNKAVRLTEL